MDTLTRVSLTDSLTNERRLVSRVLRHWHDTAKDRRCPSESQINPGVNHDYGEQRGVAVSPVNVPKQLCAEFDDGLHEPQAPVPNPPFRTGPGRNLQLRRKKHLRGRLPPPHRSCRSPAFADRLGGLCRVAVKIAAWMATESWFRPPTAIMSEKGWLSDISSWGWWPEC